MTDEERILAFLRVSGPTTPTKVAKTINQSILLASAHLSDLISRKKVKISSLKIGGSPLYYLAGQEEQLFPYAAGNINPKDQMVLEELKEKKVLRETDLDLLHRVSLRGLKDFAIPLQVNNGGTTELFWKWHLLPDEEADHVIGNILQPMAVPLTAPSIPSASPEQQASPAHSLSPSPSPSLFSSPERGPAVLIEEGMLVPEQLAVTEAQKSLSLQKPLSEPRARKVITESFFPRIEQFFQGKKIMVEQRETVRKNKELDFIVKVPSVVGMMKYFCKAKQKQKCDEKDLSAAYMEAQVKKLPLLFLYTDELTKKGQEMLDSGAFENVVVKKVE